MGNKLKFKKEAVPIWINEEFFYAINDGGWCAPEKFLEEQDAKRVRDAINLIVQYEEEGIALGVFEEY